MRPITFTATFDAADVNGICESQTPLAGGDLDLDGVLVTSGVAVLTTGQLERQVLLTFAADETGRTFVIYGTNAGDQSITRTVAGAAATAVSLSGFKTVTRITVDAATAGAIQIGTNGVGYSIPLIADIYIDPYNVQIAVDVTGTINYTVQETVYDPFVEDPGALAWTNITALASQTGDVQAVQTSPVRAYRYVQNSFTAPAFGVVNLIQVGLM